MLVQKKTKKQLELFCLYLMRQNTEGTQINVRLPRLKNNAHPLQNAGFKLYILVTLPLKGLNIVQ